MIMFVLKLIIHNFKSFVGKKEVYLRPYAAVMFGTGDNVGKNDFALAVNFLFGRCLDDLGVESIDEMYHECFRDNSTYPVLEVSAVFDMNSSTGITLALSRSIINGKMIYLVNQDEVDFKFYKNVITGMGCESEFILQHSHFVQAMMDKKGIELVISDLFRKDFKYEEIQLKLQTAKIAEIALKMQNEKHCLIMIKQHTDVDTMVDEYQKNLRDQETLRQSTIESLPYITQGIFDSESSQTSTPCSGMEIDSTTEAENEEESCSLISDEYNKLVLEENKLLGAILYNETLLATAEDDVTFMQGMKAEKYGIEHQIHKMESDYNEIWSEISVTVDEIAFDMADIEEIRVKSPAFITRLTAYGRLINWIKPGQFLWIFRAVLGDSLLYGHLIDERKDAEEFMKHLKDRWVQSRETFIILANYPLLKKMLLENGEKGLVVKTLHDVLACLIEFKNCALIDSVPTLVVQGELSIDTLDAENGVIFVSTGEYISSGAIFGRHCVNSPRCVDVPDILASVNQQLDRQDMLFDLSLKKISEIFKLRLDFELLTKHVRIAPLFLRRSEPFRQPVVAISDIYHEYEQLFLDYENTLNRDIIDYDAWETNQTDLNKLAKTLRILKENLGKIENVKKEKAEELRSARKRLNRKLLDTLKEKLAIGHSYIQPQPAKDIPALTLATRMKEISEIIKTNEMEDLKEGVQWRQMVLENLRLDLNRTKREANQSRRDVEKSIVNRVNDLKPIVEFCNESMSKMLQTIFGQPVICELRSNDDKTLKLWIGLGNNRMMNVMDCNIFQRCVALLVLFLHIASYRGGAILLIDDLSDFFPKSDYDVECVLGQPGVTRLELMTRVSDAVKEFLQKNQRLGNDSPKDEALMNLDQVILLTSDDLGVSTDIQVLISKDILEDSSHLVSSVINI